MQLNWLLSPVNSYWDLRSRVRLTTTLKHIVKQTTINKQHHGYKILLTARVQISKDQTTIY